MLFIYHERDEPKLVAPPRNVRALLFNGMIKKYKDTKICDIPFTSEFTLKTIKFKNGTEKPVVKFKVIIDNWEELRSEKSIFDPKMMKWIAEEQEFGVIDNYVEE